ncbi:MAG TPA: CPBP family intramembrane glutamic endopeptidase [Candidatus Acidoferrales bacterium]|nr:CPBP family intramembrane glutamic endopeptidase [Candidatus Acidoferrales bacterium]
MSPARRLIGVRLIPTRVEDSLRWIRPDLWQRLLPFGLAALVVWLIWRPAWLGFAWGWLPVQVVFGLVAAPLLFVAALSVAKALARRRGTMLVPADARDAWLQAGYYLLNGPLEEAFFRGVVQGGLSAFVHPLAGFLVGTAAYVFYHRLGRWPWPDTLATALLGVPLGLAFWLLPGAPSLLGVSIAHVGATCGFLGPGPWLLARTSRPVR